MASLTRWTWVWISSGCWWWTGKLGVWQSIRSQRLRHDWATELNWLISTPSCSYPLQSHFFANLCMLLFRCSVVSNSLWPHWLQHALLPCPSPSPGVCLNSRPLSQTCHLIISSSVTPFIPALSLSQPSGSFTISWFFASGGRSIGASASVFPMNIQGWFLLRLTGLFLLSKGLLRFFSSTTVWKHQFFSAQPSLWSNSHMCTWHLESLNILEINLLSLHHLQILSPILWVVFCLVYDILCCTKACKFNEVPCAYFCFYFHYS